MDFLAECVATTMELRDKALFLGFDIVATLLESARSRSDNLRYALIDERAGPNASARHWIDKATKSRS